MTDAVTVLNGFVNERTLAVRVLGNEHGGGRNASVVVLPLLLGDEPRAVNARGRRRCLRGGVLRQCSVKSCQLDDSHALLPFLEGECCQARPTRHDQGSQVVRRPELPRSLTRWRKTRRTNHSVQRDAGEPVSDERAKSSACAILDGSSSPIHVPLRR